ncbi:hypothetical protein [Thalassotalea marina]|uniref:Uncharacterized protein n=1 Tax=Thalassotalea marina TaxID=1673741 RepID=A0A919BRF1_9GAMM|nr:hypothetical protein [Thalassotalea marina]GHG07905.1 hypothetical protein GCM10017161_42100 [Thalassotalea marina]
MWAIISTSKNLKFFDLKGTTAKEIEGLSYFVKHKGNVPEIPFEHNFAVTTLIEHGVPLFINKADARSEAVALNLTGFKYLKLTPTIIKF